MGHVITACIFPLHLGMMMMMMRGVQLFIILGTLWVPKRKDLNIISEYK